MSNEINVQELLADNDIVEVVGKHIELEKKGAEHVGLCPFHDDKKKSLQVNPRKQIYKCFACGAGGDSIDFEMRYTGATFKEACKSISNDLNLGENAEKRQAKKPKLNAWKHVSPVLENAPEPDLHHYRLGKPSKSWVYNDANGKTVGYVCRFETDEGKVVLPYVWATDGKREEWRWMGFSKPRPLYNLDLITEYPDKPVMIVEGEKTADAGSFFFANPVTTTWIGGANAIKHTDWSVLKNRTVILFPDNDDAGKTAMHEIASILKGFECKIRWVYVPETYPNKWDIADWNEETEAAKSVISKWIAAYKEPTAPEPTPQEEPQEVEPPKAPQQPPPPSDEGFEAGQHELGAEYFRFLGHEKGESGGEAYRFFHCQTKKLIRLTPSGLSKNNLLSLAPLSFWEMNFEAKKGAFNIDAAVNWIIQASQDMKLFSDEFIRGRGAWMDKDRVVINTGDSLIVNGAKQELGTIRGKYVYEAEKPLGMNVENPLPKEEAFKLIEMLKFINWEREANAHLLAGWCVIAPVCGALKWRPHIWLTGSAGTGKSWLMDKVCSRFLGETRVKVQGATTEAGVRQKLGKDALPVVFDEAEGEDKASQERVQNVLQLMRAASSEDGGDIVKGTSGGQSQTFVIRSCFAFASIVFQAQQQSDKSRITVLGLNKYMDGDPKKDENWQKLQRYYSEVVTDEYIQRLHARTIKLLPIILQNAETFANAAAAVLGQKRAGDQIGALLAGYYALAADGIVSYDKAVKFIQSIDWTEEKENDNSSDHASLVDHIMQHILVERTQYGSINVTIAELLDSIRTGYDITEVTPENAAKTMARHGIKIDGEYLYISNSNKNLKKILENTPWAKNHHKLLQRIDGAFASKSSVSFGPGGVQRCTVIPINAIFGED